MTTEEEIKLYKVAANWINGPVREWQNKNATKEIPISARSLRTIIDLVETRIISFFH